MWVLTLQICLKILYDFQAIISSVWVLAYSKGEIISCEAAEGQRNGNQTKIVFNCRSHGSHPFTQIFSHNKKTPGKT